MYLYKEFTRHLNVECFESAVPAIFLSYAPTFFLSPTYSENKVSPPDGPTGTIQLDVLP